MNRGHYITTNHQSRVPNRFVWLDSEAHERTEGWTRIQTWRLAVTAVDKRQSGNAPWSPTEWQTHTDPAELWRYIDGCTRAKARTVVVAHNLAYDLRITRAFEHLGALGWTVHRISVHDRSVSAVLRKDQRSLTLADSMAWLPMGLAKVGGLVGTLKHALPCMDDEDDAWEARCRMDVEIIRAAMFDLLRWVEEDDLGNWQRTGAGQAWATWRHRFYSRRVLVHGNDEATEAEAAATYTGRCEAWKHGRLPAGHWHEWDMALCYPRIAATTALPVQLRAHWRRTSMPWLRRSYPRWRLLVRATVTTELPTLPHRGDKGILWPVGTFTGWWWDVELLNAADHGAEVTPHECYQYSANPCLADWAHWVIDLVERPPDGFSAVRQAAAKHMARALIGRFGAKYTVWEPWGRAHPDALPLERIYFADDDETGRILSLGDEAWMGREQRYSADACPAIMGAVMAEARVRLWLAMRLAGLGHVAYVDTDSVIVDPDGHDRLQRWVRADEGWGLRLKNDYRHLTIMGPRQLIANGVGRVSGVPKTAERVDTHTWAGERWEGLTTALLTGRMDQVRIMPGVWNVKATDNRRRHLPGGATEPMTVGEAPGELRAGGG